MNFRVNRAVKYALLVSVVAAAPLHAQSQAPATEPLETIYVTGTAIRRIDAEQSLPVQIFDAQAIKQTGAASVNAIYTVPMNAGAGPVNVGIRPGTTFGFSVYAFDNYFTGSQTDAVENMRFTPGKARFGVAGDPFGTVAPRSLASVPVTTATVRDAATTETGLLLMYRRNTPLESEVIKVI